MKHDSARWDEYFLAAKELGPNPFYEVISSVLGESFEGKRVLELGFGAGTGLDWWLERGATVLAVDEDPRMCEYVLGRHQNEDGLEVLYGDYLEGLGRGPFDIVAGVFSLFFVSPEELEGLWLEVSSALRPSGIFVGQLIGPEDDWAKEGFASVDRQELDEMLDGWEVLYLEEVRRRGKTVFGAEKEWHVYHLILRLGD